MDWNRFCWKRISNTYTEDIKITFKNEGISLNALTQSNQYLPTLLFSFAKYEDKFVQSFIQELKLDKGKITLKHFIDEDSIELDDFLPIILYDNTKAEFDHFSYPFLQPNEDGDEVNIMFPIIEKYCARFVGSYERLKNLSIKELLTIFSYQIEEIDLLKIIQFNEKQKSDFLNGVISDFQDDSIIVYLSNKEGEQKFDFIKEIKTVNGESEFMIKNLEEQTICSFSQLLVFYEQMYIVRFSFK